jgi:hypothetical protein
LEHFRIGWINHQSECVNVKCRIVKKPINKEVWAISVGDYAEPEQKSEAEMKKQLNSKGLMGHKHLGFA